ncbi:Di-copper centre-containing protein [Tothia fuscella]|uniref:Di-copper centre-containing protein n=1 Tax=Tothia fuscella TaxID=1048955 RepID=A0A9P4NM41_9PEZI|nr:Di-copper centre-containing protein [Tothia fuscella]
MVCLTNTFVVLLLGFMIVKCSPSTAIKQSNKTACSQLRQRKAWHNLSNTEKTKYLNAELCLMNLNSTNNLLPTSRTKFQQLQEQHQIQSEFIHEVGAFLPYRLRDAGRFINSTLLDSIYGFGGNGSGLDGYVADGPFANYTLILGPGKNNSVHCLSRDIDDLASHASNSTYFDQCKKADTYVKVWDCIEFFPRSGGHSGVGGELDQMAQVLSSPGDPLFYLHHAYIDKLWWDWQNFNLSSRLYEIGGPNVRPTAELPLRKRNGDFGNMTKLDHVLSLYSIMPNKTIGDVMDTRSDFLCYKYAEP